MEWQQRFDLEKIEIYEIFNRYRKVKERDRNENEVIKLKERLKLKKEFDELHKNKFENNYSRPEKTDNYFSYFG